MSRLPKFPLLTKQQLPNRIKPEMPMFELRAADGTLVAVTHLEYWSHVLVTAPKMMNFLGELAEVLLGQRELTPKASMDLLLNAITLMGEACGESMAEGTEGGKYLAEIRKAMERAHEPEPEPEPKSEPYPTLKENLRANLPPHVIEYLHDLWKDEPFCESCGFPHPRGLRELVVVASVEPPIQRMPKEVQ